MSDHFTAPGLADEEEAWRAGVYDRFGFYDPDTPDHPDEEDALPEHDPEGLADPSPDTPF